MNALSLEVAGRWRFFFFNDAATTEIYTLSLHDALPISRAWSLRTLMYSSLTFRSSSSRLRSEEHTSELQSRRDLVCRLLLEKKNHHAFDFDLWRIDCDILCCRQCKHVFPAVPEYHFFFNDTPTLETYTLSLHDALPI